MSANCKKCGNCKCEKTVVKKDYVLMQRAAAQPFQAMSWTELKAWLLQNGYISWPVRISSMLEGFSMHVVRDIVVVTKSQEKATRLWNQLQEDKAASLRPKASQLRYMIQLTDFDKVLWRLTRHEPVDDDLFKSLKFEELQKFLERHDPEGIEAVRKLRPEQSYTIKDKEHIIMCYLQPSEALDNLYSELAKI